MNKAKVVILILIIAVGLIGIPLLGFGFSFWSFVYWWLLAFVISIIWNFKVSSGFMLWVSFSVFLLSALLISIGFRVTAESLMRASFLGWLIGLAQSFNECKNIEQ